MRQHAYCYAVWYKEPFVAEYSCYGIFYGKVQVNRCAVSGVGLRVRIWGVGCRVKRV